MGLCKGVAFSDLLLLLVRSIDDGGGLLSETIICEVGPSHQIEQKTTSEIVFSTSKVVFPTSEKNFSTSEVDFADDFWPDVGFLSTFAVSRSWRCARMYFQAAHLTCAAHLL